MTQKVHNSMLQADAGANDRVLGVDANGNVTATVVVGVDPSAAVQLATNTADISQLQTDVSNNDTDISNLQSGKYDAALAPDETIVVKQASDLTSIDSTKRYYIDGVIDMGTTEITVPSGGITITGGGFEHSKLITSASNVSLFKGATTGNLYLSGISIEVTGTGSEVFACTGATGNEALEMRAVNFNNCTSLGYISTYRQGLEDGNGRFGGSPSLELRGAWLGGYRATTVITRGVSASCDTLFRAGTGFTMQSRFLTDMNVDLGSNASLFDFSASNFPNPNTLIVKGAEVTRAGVVNPADTTIYPNIDHTVVQSRWRENVGVPNTHTGGAIEVAGEVATTVAVANTLYDVEYLSLGAGAAVHFDAVNSSKALRHLSNNPREYSVSVSYVVQGTANDEIELVVYQHDDSAGSDYLITSQTRAINNSQGGNDVAYFTMFGYAELDENDYLYMKVANKTAARNVTAKIDSFFLVRER